MVKHVILWKLDEKLTDSEKDQVKAGIYPDLFINFSKIQL